MDERRGVLTPGTALHQIHRHLQKPRRMLRSDGASPEAYLHKARSRIHHHSYLRDQERFGAFQPPPCLHVCAPGSDLVRPEVRSLNH